MFAKRIVSISLSLLMLLTMFIVPLSVSAATDDVTSVADNVTGYNLPADVQDGNILHAFSWKLSEVTQYAPEIAAAGYTAVQVSPIQLTKDTTNDGAYANDWWCFYQPLDMAIGNELGDADDLKVMCDTLHTYGIKVICDVVANHVQNSTDKTEAAKVNPTLKGYLRNTSGTRLTPYVDSTRVGQTSTDLNSQLPDIDTSNKDYQNYLINYLNSLMDCGVDGFRFDAAKHIETPDDGTCASDFWPTITNAILKKNPDAYIYGEVLGLNNLISITAYTKYINVTDYAYGNTVRTAIRSQKASGLDNYGYTGSADADNVLWVESHDTFTTNPADSGSSNNLTIPQQIAGWAVVGARKDAPALYLVRTNCAQLDVTPKLTSIKYDELIGAPGAADTWQNEAVVAVNQFKNEFVGQSEKVYTSGSLFFVQRGTTGMVISNLATTSTTVSQTCTMKDGTYYDQISGNKFTVSGGVISGKVGDSGVAVVYNPQKIAPTATVYLNSTELTCDSLNGYIDETATVTIELNNATSGSVKVSNLVEKKIDNKDGITIKLNDSIDYGDGINITVTASNGTQTTSVTHKVYKKDANETKRVYFDNTVTQWDKVHVYCKTGQSRTTEIIDFPGYAMQQVSGNPNLYYYDVPAQTNYVKFSEGKVSACIGHTVSVCGGYCGRTMPPTVIYYGTANSAANRESGGYKLTGSMIFSKLEFKDYGEYPIATLSSSDVTYDDYNDKPTETKPVEVPDELMLGDTDFTSSITILDATIIQRHLAHIINFAPEQLICGDVDNSGAVNILDATQIQRHLAHLPAPSGIGKIIENSQDPTVPVEMVTITLNDTTAFNDADIYAYAFNADGSTNAEWPGQKMTTKDGGYSLEIDKTLTHVKFVGVYDLATLTTIESNEFEVKTSAYTLQSLTLSTNQKWSEANIHLWNENPTNNVTTNWPGIKMYGKAGSWSFNIPVESPYIKYIINNGGSSQEGTKYIVEPDNMIDVYFTDTLGWGTVCAHAWNISGGINATWPGEKMELVETNDQGQNVYKISVEPGAYTNIIFNNNGMGIQTVNLTLQGIPNEGFYPTSAVDGKYDCATYIYGE